MQRGTKSQRVRYLLAEMGFLAWQRGFNAQLLVDDSISLTTTTRTCDICECVDGTARTTRPAAECCQRRRHTVVATSLVRCTRRSQTGKCVAKPSASPRGHQRPLSDCKTSIALIISTHMSINSESFLLRSVRYIRRVLTSLKSL